MPLQNQLEPTAPAVVDTEEPLLVHVCRDWNELEGFRHAWNLLLDENPNASIFLTPEWQAS